ncbi:MAG: gliding motility-associated ABC transporter substrate-binding protein GldG [Bacteroidales bacterium]|nr:gliding motility-associated ABC transporter substrate-binding protein GldG [Bacteroidales bacterium]
MKRKSYLYILGILMLIFLINIISSRFFFRIDLTQEKKYTLSSTTRQILRSLDDIVYFKIYLEGDLPAEYRKLRNAIRDMLDEFKAYNKSKIQYDFINPFEGKDKRTIQDIYEELTGKGLYPTVDHRFEAESQERKVIWPCALAYYKDREIPINFVQAFQQVNKEILINQSIENIEFNLVDAIRRLQKTQKYTVAFLQGHGEAEPMLVDDLARSLSEYYTVKKVVINHQLKALDGVRTLIIVGPDSVFDEKDKFIIDQFIMKGGRVLWLIDGAWTTIDSLRSRPEVPAIANEINLEDMLFKYGVRVNPNILLDLNSCPIPIKTGEEGGRPVFNYYNFYYFPAIANPRGHPIVRNINAIRFEFASTIDTIPVPHVKKTILLTSSQFSRVLNTPTIVSLRVLQEEPSKQFFNKSFLPVAVLLEGQFQSVFKHRLPPEIEKDTGIGFQAESKPTKMIVVSDGNVAQNQFIYQQGSFYTFPLGYDRFTKITYGNKDFILNCVSYLTDEQNILDIRSREIIIRLLDKTKVKSYRNFIVFLNIFLPVFFIVLSGITFVIIKRVSLRKWLKR